MSAFVRLFGDEVKKKDVKTMAVICGKSIPEAEGMTITGYIEKAGFTKGRIAVEYNGEILPKEDYEKTVIASSDNIEIVEFMGGG